ncbi:MAG: VOC family protein [Bacteroidota bacterium]
MAAQKLFSHSAIVFAVEDVQLSAAYYRDKLGFDIVFTWEDPPSYAVVNREDAVGIHLTQKAGQNSGESVKQEQNSSGDQTALFIFVHDVDKVYEEFLGKGVEILQPPGNRAYGMRDFDIRDVNGYVLTIGTGLARLTTNGEGKTS